MRRLDRHPQADRSTAARVCSNATAHPRSARLLLVLVLIAAFSALYLHYTRSGLQWSLPQILCASVLLLDGLVGVWMLATNPGSAHRGVLRLAVLRHLGLACWHLSHLALVAWFFAVGDIVWFVGAASALVLAVVIAQCLPGRLRLPGVCVLYFLCLLWAFYYLPPIRGLEWYLPLLFIKLLLAYPLGEQWQRWRRHLDDPI